MIPQLEGYEAFNFLGKHKAPASATTNHKPSLPRGPNQERRRALEDKYVLAKVGKYYAGKLKFLSQAARSLILLLCPMNPPSNYILNEATIIEHKAARRILKWPP